MKRASQDQELLKILKEMEALQAEYPEELLSARRASFLEQVDQSIPVKAEQTVLEDSKLVNQLRSLGSQPVKYPPLLMAARRAAFVRRIAWLNFVSLCTAVWLAVQKRVHVPSFPVRNPPSRVFPASLLAASLALAVFAGFLFYQNQASLSYASLPQSGTVQSGLMLSSDTREVRIICKPGAQPPLCLAGEYKKTEPLAYQGNGTARPAVAKDTMTDSGEIHKAAYLNDGLYGPGAGWISNSRNSWIKIDLGKTTEINTVTFGRDRLGKLSGHNPGQFVVALALADDVYANGNNSNDSKEYQPVFNSKQAGFSGKISGAETVVAQFAPREARYIKITFENKGAAVDEVEAFMERPALASHLPSTPSKNKPSSNPSASQVASTFYPSFTATSLPANTATSQPTATLIPSSTATPIPTATEIPSNTPVPTNTPVETSTSVPTSTLTSEPSSTPVPPPSDTPVPPPSDTPVPPEPAIPEPTEPPTQSDLSPRVDYLHDLTRVPAALP